MDRIRVLVVDDSLTIRAMMTRVLEADNQIRVAAAVSSAEAADEALRDNLVDVVTLDVEMPGTSGLDYLQQLVKRNDVPVVMLSSHMGKGDMMRAEALAAGAAGCFNKADAVREAPALLRLIKSAAKHRARLDPEDRQALKAIRLDNT